MAKCDYEIDKYEVSWKRGREAFLRDFKCEEDALEFAEGLIDARRKDVEVRKILCAIGWL